MTRMYRLLATVGLGMLLAGCVPQEKYNALRLERDQLAERLAQCQNEASAARAEAESYRNQLNQIMSAGGNLQALVNNLTQQVADLQARNDELNRLYSEALARAGQGGMAALPAALTSALTDFAAQNPDLVEFDPATGIVRFKSDVTFASGDATLSPRAREVLGRLAQILNSDTARGFDLMLAGHTDNVRVANPETVRRGHKDNWYLSAHRAISVREELERQRVGAGRMAVVGYADQRPTASNATADGRQANRRVEVLMLQGRGGGGTVAGGASVAPAAAGSATPAENPALNK